MGQLTRMDLEQLDSCHGCSKLGHTLMVEDLGDLLEVYINKQEEQPCEWPQDDLTATHSS